MAKDNMGSKPGSKKMLKKKRLPKHPNPPGFDAGKMPKKPKPKMKKGGKK